MQGFSLHLVAAKGIIYTYWANTENRIIIWLTVFKISSLKNTPKNYVMRFDCPAV